MKNFKKDLQDINKALKIQSDETLKDGKKRFIGEILEASFDLTPKETIKILKTLKILVIC